MRRKAYNYQCLRCRSCIASSDTALDVPNICLKCADKEIQQCLKRQKESINFADESTKRKKQYKKRKYTRKHDKQTQSMEESKRT